MRIPVSNADLDQGRFTKISRALQKLWQLDSLSLMQAQNTMATFLGYRNLHDLQGQACPASQFPPTPGLSRASVINAVAWQMFRRHGLNFIHAAEIAAGLHLKSLDIDGATSEAAFERTQDEYRQRGQLLIVDEAWQLLNPHWNPKTPQLLDAHVPGYEFAVLPNQQVFRWSLLERLMEYLPTDFKDDLRQEAPYGGMSDGDMEMKFVSQELLPSACEPLLESVKKAQVRPDGFEIIWLFSGDGECLGRVLYNKALGGIVPVLYGISDDGIYAAIGTLLCGRTICSTASEVRPEDIPAYTLRFFHGGYDLAADLRRYAKYGEDRPDTKPASSDLDRLPSHIGIRNEGGTFCLHGSTFIEKGQTYLRYQPKWLRVSDIPSEILAPEEISTQLAEQSERGYVDTAETIPDAARMLFMKANQRLQQRFSDAMARLQSVDGVADLTNLLFKLTAPKVLDAYCNALIDEHLPVRLEESIEDDEDLIAERSREMQSLEWKGAAIKRAIPALAQFNDTSLGLILLLANGEYPGSRYGGFAYAPEEGQTKEIVEFMAGFVLHAACCHAGNAAPDQSISSNVLCFAVDSVLEGKTTPAELAKLCLAVTTLSKRLDEHTETEKAVANWRETTKAIDSIRSTGEFLYVGKPVSREKPKTMADLFAQARSSGFVMLSANQTLAAMAQDSES